MVRVRTARRRASARPRSLDVSSTGGNDDDPRSLGPGDVGSGRPRSVGGVISGARLGEGVLVDRRRNQWFRTADTNLGLFPYQDLADDAQIASPERGSFGGITLAINVERPEDVDVAIAAAVEAGGSVLKPGTDAPFGRSGYFAGPDGYPWEVAYNRDFPIDEDGRLTIRSARSRRDRPYPVSVGGLPSTDRFLRACRRAPVDRTPVWFMRQAGQYFPSIERCAGRATS